MSSLSTENMQSDLTSVIIVNWNGAKFLKKCVDSVLNQSYRNIEILIIDNASDDNSLEVIQGEVLSAPDIPIRIIENSENRGYCKGCNQGIDLASGTYILILNPDIILTSDFIKNLVSSIELDSRIGMVAGKLVRFDGVTLDTTGQFLRWNLTPLERGYGKKDTGQFNTPGYSFSTCGAAAFYKRAMLEDIKIKDEYFDESFFTYYEDLDLGWRAQLFGWKCYYNPKALAFHYRGGGLSTINSQSSLTITGGQPTKNFPPKFSFTEKPFSLQKHILKNRYLTLIKNLNVKDFLIALPSLLLFESFIWSYVCLIQPNLFRILPEVFRLLPEILEKRRIIQSRRVVSVFYIKSWIRS